ncbi:AMIN domain-containing protein [Helicobacter ibis]|uniref:AMIN domain-containing protein n=1 Tax=Helicobacter ibis TaxID=2962633 RepID=A0ABT4VE95_9HELI|nr:AMIN domain-containing protein [Helicobacter ibis]MDA3969014.1 AMIN domain-containing protein [Helicobacter ibis]
MKKIALLLITSFAFANEPQTLPQIPTIQNNDNNTTMQPINNSLNNPLIPEISKEATPNTQEITQNANKRDPFQSQITPKESGQISNAPNLNLFSKAELNLPSTARKLKKITIEYQNLNGSITSIEKEIDGDIDWHFPLVLKQDLQPKVTEKPTNSNFTLGEKFKFKINEQTLNLQTPYTLLRNFTLASPTRLVLDFKNPTKKEFEEGISTNLPVITDATIQTHLDFFRITLNLDGQYNYKLDQKDKEITIEFQ